MKKFLKCLPVIVLLILNIFFALMLAPNNTSIVAANDRFGKIVITVLEKGTNKPIDNAKICLIETHEYFSTNKNGLSDTLQVPILRNENFDNSLKRTWGDITLLVYKPGYSDHISFYEQVPVNQTRLGVVIYLSPIYSETDTAPTITTNTPDKTWINELIKLYKK